MTRPRLLNPIFFFLLGSPVALGAADTAGHGSEDQPPPREICNNGVDDDDDGLTDEVGDCIYVQFNPHLANPGTGRGPNDPIGHGFIEQGEDGQTEIQPCFLTGGCMGLIQADAFLGRGALFMLDDTNLWGTGYSSDIHLILKGDLNDALGSMATNHAVTTVDSNVIAAGALGNDKIYFMDDFTANGEKLISDLSSAVVYGVSGEDFGSQLAAARDSDGDGYGDILAASMDRVVLMFGPFNTSYAATSANTWELTPSTTSVELGHTIAGLGDINNDGFDDFAVSDPGYDSDRGAVYVFHGGTGISPGSATLADADVVWTGEALGNRAGIAVAGIGDRNGDGIDDYAIGAPETNWGGTDAGTAYIIHGSTTTSSGGSLWGADTVIDGDVAKDNFGAAIAGGDLNGDGKNEVVVGAPGRDSGGAESGSAFVLFTQGTGLVTLADVGNEFAGDVGTTLGHVVNVFDTNDDGFDDVVLLHGTETYTIISGKLF